MKKRKSIISKLLMATLIVVIFTAACQPTPENAAVVDGRDLQEIIERSSASMQAYDAPKTWQETLDMKGSKTDVDIDASVIVPDVTAFPVYKSVQTSFDNETTQPIVDYFVQDRDVVKLTEPTKADIEQEILLARKKGQDDYIPDLENQLKNAPESIELEYITDWTLKSDDQRIHGGMIINDGEYTSISLSPHQLMYSNGDIWRESELEISGKADFGRIDISEDDAVSLAKSAIEEFGIKDMVVCSVEKALAYPRSGFWFSAVSDIPFWKGYHIQFVRNIDGIPTRVDEPGGYFNIDDYQYKTPFFAEDIGICIDEKGNVQQFYWSEPFKLTEKVSGNVALMPFDEVKEKIRDQLFYTHAYYNAYYTENITVERVEMKMALIGVKDRPDEAMYVPAWFVYSVIKHSPPITDPMGYEISEEDVNTIVINAIDGGRILEFPAEMLENG